MFHLSYNANGLRNMPLPQAIVEVARAGYEGIELSLHSAHLHPFRATDSAVDDLRRLLETVGVKPVCLATGAADLLDDVAYEPSLISPDEQGRRRRIELICGALDIARHMGIPVVNFASGIRQEGVPADEARQMLAEGVKTCLRHADGAILAIEPEPGMFVETTSQALDLIREIGSAHLMLNLDVGHVQCCEPDLLRSVAAVLDCTRHVHVEDIKGRVHHHEIPGEGDIDFAGLFEVLRAHGYSHYLSVELYHHADVWERALRESRKHLLEHMEAVGAGV